MFDAAWRKSSHSGAHEDSCVEVAVIWHKSSRSGGDEGESVELAAVQHERGHSETNEDDRAGVAAIWHRSSHSGGDEGNCVQVATTERFVAARDSKNPTGPVLFLTPAAWHALNTKIKAGAYDPASAD
jgi:hypothetical protein